MPKESPADKVYYYLQNLQDSEIGSIKNDCFKNKASEVKKTFCVKCLATAAAIRFRYRTSKSRCRNFQQN